MMRKRRMVMWLALLAGGFAATCRGGEPVDVATLIRQKATAFVEKPGILGIVVGVQRGDQSYSSAAGQWSLNDQRPVDESTLFEIGSVTKAFTGLLLADAVVRGEVKLEQPLAELLGANTPVPDYEGQPIRLVHLATHTSGLPRLPNNMKMANPLNPYADYTAANLEQFLTEYKLSRQPGETSEYSNLGMGLLGYALAKRARKSYEELLGERILRPLEMDDTTISLSDEQQPRLAKGITSFMVPMLPWDFQALAGYGAIRSTLHDMMIFLRANLSP